VINTLGNRAVHSHRPVPEADALAAVRELFHVAYWFARTYGRTGRPAPGLVFDAAALPRPERVAAQSAEQLQALEARLREKDENLAALLAEVAEAKQAAAAQPDTHDYSEAETRDYFIDLLLKEVGWALDQARDRELEVSGMPNAEDRGFVDYVLWGDDGKPLGLVEAKRARRDPRAGQQQAKLYADCLERQFGRRPVIFYSNGYEHWLWDDSRYPPRRVQGFYKKPELDLLIQPDHRRAPLPDAGHPPCRRSVRARPRPQGAARNGDGRRQDADGDRALRPLDALQLGEARILSRRSRGARESGRQRLRAPFAGRFAREPRHPTRGPRGASTSRPIPP
jgi:type I restriction enzyme R subunit